MTRPIDVRVCSAFQTPNDAAGCAVPPSGLSPIKSIAFRIKTITGMEVVEFLYFRGPSAAKIQRTANGADVFRSARLSSPNSSFMQAASSNFPGDKDTADIKLREADPEGVSRLKGYLCKQKEKIRPHHFHHHDHRHLHRLRHFFQERQSSHSPPAESPAGHIGVCHCRHLHCLWRIGHPASFASR